MEIIVNAPAISMEEVLPLAVSTHTQLAPEEVLAKQRREVKGNTELTDVCVVLLRGWVISGLENILCLYWSLTPLDFCMYVRPGG